MIKNFSCNLSDPVQIDPSRQSLVRVYYGDKYVKEFEQSMISTWYDLLSSLGGIVALITGGSLMIIVELTYLLTGRFGAIFIRSWSEKRAEKKETQKRHVRDDDEGSTVRDDVIPPFIRLRKSSIAFVN